MDRVFKSEIGWWYHLLIFVMIVLCIVSILSRHVAMIIASLLSSAFISHVFFNTYYVVTAEGVLELYCSFFPKKKINIAEIEALQPSILPVSSYALSLNRLIIWKDGKMWMLISPKNRKEFVNLLLKYNPEITLKQSSAL